MSVGFYRQPLPVSFIGYGLGTACAGSASLAVENIMQHYDHDPDQIQITKALIYSTVYSLAYQQGYVLAHHRLNSDYHRISDAQALQQLGLYSNASEQEVKKRYHQLSLENHIDKCKTSACAEKWTEITEAYAVLMKKRA
ncbi:MAG: DnaJ domain-containing protein [Proteobacteria bacterium]|nr:DnaJ domain-containing protein [Pseudomonadota bacterium]